MKKLFTKEVSIGIITIISLVILYLGVNYLKGINLLKPTNHYYVRINNVHELQKSSPVYVNGFRIGLVNDIEYDYTDQDGIIALISLDKKMKVEQGSYFKLNTGLTSGAYLDLILNQYVSEFHQIGDTLNGIAEPGMMEKLSSDLLPQVENLLPRLDSILWGVQTLLTHPALHQSLDHISATTSQLEKSSASLNRLLSGEVTSILSNVNQVSEDMTVITHNFKQLDFNSTLTTVENTLKNIDQMTNRLNSKDSSLGLLLNDRSLYDNLDSTAENASILLRDLKENPKRYVHFSIF